MSSAPPIGPADPEPFQDRSLTCVKCGKAFVFTAGEQAFYAEKGFEGAPARCEDCRGIVQSQPPSGLVQDTVNTFKRVAAKMTSSSQPAEGRAVFDRFTERAKKVMTLARDEGRRLNHNYIGTEHLLLGLVAVEDGIGAKVLKSRGVELNKVRSGVEFIIGRGDKQVVGDVSLTPRTKKVIELAVDEARQLKHNYVGTEHLLLGLIREGEGIAIGVLESLGVNLGETRQQIVDMVTRAADAHQKRRSAGGTGLPGVSDVTGSKDSVITCRIPSGDLEAIDALIEAGIRTTRSDAASWLIHAGIQANLDLFDKVYSTVAEIKRLREQAQSAAQQLDSRARPAPPASEPPAADEPPSEDPAGPEEPEASS
ncbi:MAG TPA: Clp protease N-terminal domain-containing protein [Chloroflexota bacterium]|nr:Clp protease N-terminal domain-containing protein [Chloroflexota bacterium]